MAKTNLGRVMPLPKGEYSASTPYEKLDIVTYQGAAYICKVACSGVAPTDTSKWQLMAEKGGKGDKGDQGIQGIQGIAGPSGAHVDDLVIEQTTGSATDKVMSQKAVSDSLGQLAQKTGEISKKYAEDASDSIIIGETEEDPTATFENKKTNFFGHVFVNGKDIESRIEDLENGKDSGDLPIFNGKIASDDDTVVVGETLEDPTVKIENKKTNFFGKVFVNNKDITNIGYNILNGKKWVVVGDSFSTNADETITEDSYIHGGKYDGQKKDYGYIIGNRNDMEIVNFHQGGKTIAYPADRTFQNSFCNPTSSYTKAYKDIPLDADYITIQLGINDQSHIRQSSGDGESVQGVITLGTINSEDTSTFYGAWNVALEWIITNLPFCHIGIIITNGFGNTNGTSSQLAKDMYDAEIAIAKRWGIPYLDLNGDERCPMMHRGYNPNLCDKAIQLRLSAFTEGASGTHPNSKAYEYESTFIENFLRTI